MSYESDEVETYFNFILPLVKEEGKHFLKAAQEHVKIETKSDHDLVTKYDKKIEYNLINQIKAAYPNHKIISEERSELTQESFKLTNEPTWIIDPIDGTTNFSKKIPECGISIGLVINKEQVLGIVFIPYLNELYTAMRGKGAFRNAERIKCSNVIDPKKSLLCYEIAVTSRTNHSPEIISSRFSYYVTEVFAMRSMGCPVLSQCYVAAGKFDGYHCDGLYPWDAAAGTLIIKEAGGYIIESSGKEFDLMKPNFLATSTKELAEKYIEIIRRADETRRRSNTN